MHGGRLVALGEPGILKKELGSYAVLRLKSADPAGGMRALENKPYLVDVSPIGQDLRPRLTAIGTAVGSRRNDSGTGDRGRGEPKEEPRPRHGGSRGFCFDAQSRKRRIHGLRRGVGFFRVFRN